MGRMISVWVSDRTRCEVARLAWVSRRTESAVVREAIEEYVARTFVLRPYEVFWDVIGMVEGGLADLSENIGGKFRELLLVWRAVWR
jgi:hypothetical protein